MRPIFYDLLLGYICLNLAIYVVGVLGVLTYSIPAPSSPTAMNSVFGTTVFTGLLTNPLAIIGVSVSGLGGLAILLLGKNLVGFGFITLAMLMVFVPTLTFIIAGFVPLMVAFGVPVWLETVVMVIVGFVFITFVVEFVGQRDVG
jgi:hypothetical protein